MIDTENAGVSQKLKKHGEKNCGGEKQEKSVLNDLATLNWCTSSSACCKNLCTNKSTFCKFAYSLLTEKRRGRERERDLIDESHGPVLPVFQRAQLHHRVLFLATILEVT